MVTTARRAVLERRLVLEQPSAPGPRGRWMAFALVSAALGWGCDETPEAAVPKVTGERSQAIMAAPGAPSDASAGVAKAGSKGAETPASDVAAGRKGPLCSAKPGGKLPTSSVGGLGSRSQAYSGGKPAAGRLTWVNLWAAWCEPCKKELPLLVEFQTKLKERGVPLELAFFSIDDDERQLSQFLDAQPPGGLRRTLWLREGKERDDWLAEARLPSDPRLPVHLLVAPNGEIFCRIDGSIEASDFDEAATLLSAHR